jgi:chromatin remodeling complex protein RSC6
MAESKQARGGIAQEVKPDEQLAAVVGKDPLTRANLTKKVWDYIKANNLQDSKDRRSINADAKLRPIFGKDQVTMFEMTKLINQHVSKA